MVLLYLLFSVSLNFSLSFGNELGHSEDIKNNSNVIEADSKRLQTIYTDIRGHQWSGVLQDQYLNCMGFYEGNGFYKCDPPKQSIQSSEASNACKEKGWRLPSVKDFEYLIKSFDHQSLSGRLYLTEKGKKSFLDKFLVSRKNSDTSLHSSTEAKSKSGFLSSQTLFLSNIMTIERLKTLCPKDLKNCEYVSAKDSHSGMLDPAPRFHLKNVVCVKNSDLVSLN